MVTATNVDANAVNTVAWLSAAETSIVVPVYQRQYRWDIGGCEQLLGRHPRCRRFERHRDALHRLDPVDEERSGGCRRARAHRRPAAHHDAHAPHRRAAPHRPAPTTPPSPRELERVLVRADDPTRDEAAAPPGVGRRLRERRPRPPARGRRAARLALRRQLRVLPQPDPRRRGAAHLAGTAEARARRHLARRRRERAADLREPQLHRRAAARPRADPQLRADGPLARRAERDRRRRSGCRSSRTPASRSAASGATTSS